MKRLIFIISVVFFGSSVLIAQDVIPIINPSFELPADGQKIQDPNLMDGWYCDKTGGTDSGRESSGSAPDGNMIGFSRNSDGHIYQPVDTIDNKGGYYNLSLKSTITWNGASDPTSYCATFFSVMDQGADFSTRTIIDSSATEIVSGEWRDVYHVFYVPASYEGKVLIIEYAMITVASDDAWAGYDVFSLIKTESAIEPSLISLSANIGDITPDFDPGVFEYTLNVPFGTTSVQLLAETNGWGATVSMFDIQGNPIENNIVSFTGDGIDLEIIVSAVDGSSITYYISIYAGDGNKDARLKDISVNASTLDPIFDPEVKDYTLVVPVGTSSLDIVAVPFYSEATVSGDGTISLSGGSASVTVTVLSADESETSTYTIAIREADGENYALYLPGSNGSASHINISGLSLSAHPYTIEMWIKPEGTQPYNAGLFYHRPHNIGVQYASSWQAADQVRFMTGVTDDYGTLTGNIATDVWHHLAVVLTDSFRIVYLDGVMTSQKIESPVLEYSDGELYIGWDSDNTEKAFKGSIDEVRVWNDSLTAEELELNRLHVLNGDEENLAAYWNFDLNSPTIAVDMTANGTHGVIKGGSYVESFPRKNLNLDTLYVENAKLKPGFVPGYPDFYIVLPKGSTSVNIVATPAEEGAIVSGTGSINIGEPSGIFTITVTSADGTESMDYNIHYVVDTDLTLKHSYTFADGTAQDMVGNAHGDVLGGEITDGVFVSSVEGDYIKLPGEELSLYKFPSVTLEAYVTAGNNADNYTMTAYFGGLQSNNSLWIQLSRPTDASRFELNTAGAMSYVEATEPAPGENHHYVGIATHDTIYWYIDGSLAVKSATLDNTIIARIDTANAWLCYGGWNDPTWLGSMYEFNIYSGVMDEATISARSVNFPVEDASTDATLSDLTLDGTTIENFASYTLNYDVFLPSGTTTPPSVTGTCKNANASLAVTDATGIPGTATIEVTAQDGITTVTYTVNFKYQPSDIAQLSDILVDGTSLEGFDPATTSYDVGLAKGTTAVPVVTAESTNPNATIQVNNAEAIPGTTSIIVTAEDGITTLTYSLNFYIQLSPDATLSDIMVDGSSISGFSPEIVTYQKELPPGTTDIPVVTVTTTDPNATYEITNATSLPGNAIIEVLAEDEEHEKTYMVYFLLVGIDDLYGESTKIYPTVSDGKFMLETTSENYRVSVYDISGSLLYVRDGEGYRMNIHTPEAGIYILKVDFNKSCQVFRIVHVD